MLIGPFENHWTRWWGGLHTPRPVVNPALAREGPLHWRARRPFGDIDKWTKDTANDHWGCGGKKEGVGNCLGASSLKASLGRWHWSWLERWVHQVLEECCWFRECWRSGGAPWTSGAARDFPLLLWGGTVRDQKPHPYCEVSICKRRGIR